MAESVTSRFELDILPYLSSLDKAETGLVNFKQLQDKVFSDSPFREAAKDASVYEKELADNTKRMSELEAITKTYEQEIRKLNTQLTQQEKVLKQVTAATKYKQSTNEVKILKEEIKKLNKELENTSKRGKDAATMMSRIKGGFMGAFTGLATGGGAGVQAGAAVLGAINPVLGVTAGILGSVSEKAFAATSAWQGYTVALSNSLGSQDLANKNLSVLEELAVRLPVGLNEVTESFNQLVNRGFKPTKDELSNLSGFAAAQNKTFDQLIQAILDAESGELERLKEFGIQAKNEGGKVSITFRGVTQTFRKGALESASAFAELAKQLGSDKLNADKMNTLAGRMSNLSDQSDSLARKFGELLLPVFEGLLSVASKILEVIDDAVTGWGEFDKVLNQVSKTGEENTYPTLKKIFDLFKSDGNGSTVKDFLFSLNAGFEKLLATFELLSSINPYKGLDGLKENYATYKQNLDNINKAITEYYTSGNKKTSAGDFQYKDSGPTKPPGPTEEELKLMERRARELAELERKLQDELLKIENEYGKEKIEALKDNELQYIEEKRKFDLMRIDQEEKALLKLKQIVSGARKGQYDRNGKVIADSSATLSESERAPFDFRRQLVNSEAYKDQADFISKAEREITNILSNEYQRQLQATEYKYEELFKLAKKSGVDITKLEREKQKEINKINTDKAISDIEKKSLQEQGDAEANILRAQIDGRELQELDARKGLLEIEKKFIKQKIEIIKASGDEEADARVRAYEKMLLEIDKGIKDLEDKKKDRTGVEKFLEDTLGMKEGDADKAIEAAQLFADRIKSITSELYGTLNRLSQERISRINEEISKKEDQVKKEEELDKEGVANNLNLRLKELSDLKNARERALEDQRRLQRTQLIVDTATQASSMITAASKVYSGFAGIPIVGVGLGVAAVALMLGAFAAAKIKAFQLVNQQPAQFEKGGRHKGRRHSEGGELVEVEDGEWTINRNSSREHDELLDAINQNDKGRMLDYLLTDLLKDTGVSLSHKDRIREQRYIQSYQKTQASVEKESLSELRAIRAELEEVKKATSFIPKTQDTSLGNGKILQVHTKNGNKDILDVSDMLKK